MIIDTAPLFSAYSPIPSHALAALGAVVIGGFQLAMAKGSMRHKLMGYVWVGLMLYVSISSFFIHDIRLFFGMFSPIHILSIITIVSVVFGVLAARRGEITRHEKHMKSLYLLALVVTGFFTLMPGRIMHQVVFAN